jgi:hypothetical protein
MKAIKPLITIFVISTLPLLIDLNLSSCTKTDTRTVTVQDTTYLTARDTTVVNDTLRSADTVGSAPSILSLLTGKQWEFDSVYVNSTGPGTGTLAYVRGGSSNAVDLDNEFYTWTSNGDFWFYQNSTYYLSQWSFWNGDSSNYKIVSTVLPTDYGRIIKLSATGLTIYDSTLKTLDIQIPTP